MIFHSDNKNLALIKSALKLTTNNPKCITISTMESLAVAPVRMIGKVMFK